MASTYLTYTPSAGDATARQKWTWSAWVKRSKLGSSQFLFCGGDGGSYPTQIYLSSGDVFAVYDTGENATAATSAKLRDTSAWYHLVARFDATQGTAADKMKLYINGVQQSLGTSWNQSNTNPSSMGKGETHVLGRRSSGDNFNGLMSHVHFCLGYSYGPDSFGSTDSTTGEWKINTSPSVSYGSQGFWWLKDNITTTDHSPNSNTFTVSGGTLTKTEDNPSNVFATLSPDILPRNAGETIANGNLFFGTSAAIWNTESSAFGITSGKYYFEVKLKDNGTDRRFRWGLQKNDAITTTGENKVLGGADNNAIGYATGGEGASQGTYIINQSSTTMSDGDINENNAIYGFAIDLDNQRMYGHFNGSYFHSGNPSAGSGGIDVSSFYTVGETLFPSFTVHNSNIEINFGNGYFGTTAVATNSGNGYQDADGNGIMNYSVPTNYRCLCTKGLNQ